MAAGSNQEMKFGIGDVRVLGVSPHTLRIKYFDSAFSQARSRRIFLYFDLAADSSPERTYAARAAHFGPLRTAVDIARPLFGTVISNYEEVSGINLQIYRENF